MIDLLIGAGYSEERIWGYTLPAIVHYSEMVMKKRNKALHDLTIAVRHSQGTDPKVFQKFLNTLWSE